MRRHAALATFLTGLAAFITAGSPVRSQSLNSVFVGSTPCGAEAREFLGGLKAEAKCHAITWRLTLATPSSGGGGSTWTVSAKYNIPAPGNPNAMVDGPQVTTSGRLEVAKIARSETPRTTYLLRGDATRKTLSLGQMAGGLLHFLTADGRLLVGTAGWSYTLSPADRAEAPGIPSQAPDMSYTISPRATGTTVFGIFEGRTACAGIARDLKLGVVPGCLKVKWRVTLNQADQPTTYKIESSLHRQQARTGTWRITRGIAGDAGAVVYQLDATPTESAVLLLRGDDNVLFLLDQARRPLIGNADFGYTLNRVGAK
jgi:hypothetical protein